MKNKSVEAENGIIRGGMVSRHHYVRVRNLQLLHPWNQLDGFDLICHIFKSSLWRHQLNLILENYLKNGHHISGVWPN